MSNAVNPLAITVGTGCNIRCRHCLVDENLGSKSVSRQEIRRLCGEINKYFPKTVIFTGGEPTLYLREIQEIISGIDPSHAPKVTLITNGYFAESRPKAEKVLKAIKYLSGVAVSYDRFHAEFVEKRSILTLLDVCREMGLKVKIACAVEAPMDLVFLDSIKRPGLAISIQQILPIGRAAEHGLKFGHMSFDPVVLEKKCPNLGGMVFNCGSGFTICCGPLASSHDKSGYVHGSIADHFKSRFYKIVSSSTFGEMAALAGVAPAQMRPEHALPCMLCSMLIPRIIDDGKNVKEG